MPQELEITIDKTGRVLLSVNDVLGPACEDITKAIEDALGEVLDRQRKPDYYQDNAAGDHVTTSS